MSDTRKFYRRLADQIAADIDTSFTPGDRLPTERDLARQYGVSRPTLREALIALEIQGRIEIRHGHGIVVREPDARDLPVADTEIGAFELIEARRLIEGEVAAMAATQIEDAHIAELEALVQQMENPDRQVSETADRAFHVLIAQLTGNGALTTTVENLWDWRNSSPLARHILSRAAELSSHERVHEHNDVLEALKARSPKAARKAMHAHMDRVVEHLLKATEIIAVEQAQKTASEHRSVINRRIHAITEAGSASETQPG